MEGIGKEVFEEWMKRLMERIDRLDSIISVLINKEAAGVKYMDGERLYDNQDLCEMLRTSKRSLPLWGREEPAGAGLCGVLYPSAASVIGHSSHGERSVSRLCRSTVAPENEFPFHLER